MAQLLAQLMAQHGTTGHVLKHHWHLKTLPPKGENEWDAHAVLRHVVTSVLCGSEWIHLNLTHSLTLQGTDSSDIHQVHSTGKPAYSVDVLAVLMIMIVFLCLL